MAPHERVVVGEPKAAGEKRTFAGRKPVVGGGAVIAKHETVHEQMLLDRLDRADHSWIVRRQEPDERNGERARVHQLWAVRLHERADLRVVWVGAHVGVDAVAQFPPLLDWAGKVKPLDASHGAIDG